MSRILPTFVLRELEGIDWELRLGKKHYQIVVGGKMISIWPRGTSRRASSPGRNPKMVVSAIRRRRREIEKEKETGLPFIDRA